MQKGKLHRLIRKWHRYLGLILGIQFLAWTVGGLYFSWTKIDEIRGDNIRKENPPLAIQSDFVAVTQITNELQKIAAIESFVSIQLVDILGKTYYQIIYLADKKEKIQLADARTGELKKPLTEDEAIEVAKSRLKGTANVEKVIYLKTTNGHHEYREKPLPAYAVDFGGSVNTTVYVSAELGTVQSFRNNRWRIFDFLWMLHTMDYQNRDSINNWLLRAFSIFGLVTILSGFGLFYVSRKKPKSYKRNDTY